VKTAKNPLIDQGKLIRIADTSLKMIKFTDKELADIKGKNIMAYERELKLI